MSSVWMTQGRTSCMGASVQNRFAESSFQYQHRTGRNLRRALDLKVKKLRSLLTADEDITTELDKIVCRLMKLALRTSEDHQSPPPATWMQRKLLDLLSLTEKAIERRRKHFIENYPLKAIEYDHYDNLKNNFRKELTLSTIQNDDTADKIVDKYLMLSSDPTSENFVVKSEVHYTEENLSITSNEMDPFTIEPKSLYGEVRLESIKSESKEEIRLEITKGWVDEDYEVVSHGKDYTDKSNIESSDSNTSNDSQYRHKKGRKICAGVYDGSDLNVSSKSKINKLAKTPSKGRQNKNKLIKKVSKKNSSSGLLAKSFSKKFEFVEYKSYTFNKPKRNFKEHYNLQPTLSKPIPRSLIELCYQDLSTEKNEKLIESSLCKDFNTHENVAATKQSLFIDIVGEGIEETLALRRSVATEADQKSDIMESEAILEAVINVTKDDDDFDANLVVPFDTVDSETIFLYDLNEPSTSKGIRHVSADAQCGTDRVCSISSAVNSLMNLSNKCETGIKIGDSFTKLRFNKTSVDFGTVTDGINFYHDLAMFKTNELRIKDSDVILTKKVECSTMTNDNDFKLEKVITPILNVINAKETNSDELRVCSSNLSKTGLRCLKNPSDSGMSQIISVTKYIRPKLSYCGIYVHSYRDRQVSEDVVFQGEWQKKGPSILARRSPCALNYRRRESIIKKKKVNSKEKLTCPRKAKDVTKISNNIPMHKQNTKYTNPKREIINKDNKIQDNKTDVLNNITKNVRNNHTLSKVASKIKTSVTKSRSGKNIAATKNRFEIKSGNIKVAQLKNSNPKYNPTNLHKLNKSVDYPKSSNKIVLPVIRSKTKTKELKESLMKFNNERRKNITYLVFRNEIENTRNTSLENSKSVTKIDDTKNNYSSTSQNSSPCSSPNSIATVRALSSKSKSYCSKWNSTSPEKKVSVENYELCKNKRNIKSTKSIKTLNESSVSCDNKENLPHTSKKHDALKDTSSKAMVNVRNKNVFMLQVRAESPSSIVRKKSENAAKSYSSSSTKILKNKNLDNYHRALSSSSFNKSLKARSKSPDDTFYKRDKACGVAEINNLTRSSTPILDIMDNFEGHERIDEQIKDTKRHIKRSNSKINAAMKQLIEERLSFIKRIPNNNDSDSETIILSKDDQDNGVNESLSPISYKTIVTNDNTCISGADIENALLNFSFESNVESLATVGSTQSRFYSTETDLFSLRSSESMTKCSGSLMHDKELDTTLVPQQSSTKAVRDLFERKDQPVLKNAGALAVQVFSGFSMDGEPVVGDQPEYTRLVDPETGNLEIARQATSEELFVSGRSSDTYESCYVEDDAYLPNWLFRIISQQQSAEIPEEEQEPEPEPEDPLVDPEYDVNGNVMEPGFGAGVGAGDGRGMHSDQSQDSSGRGTSISSSDVSSGPQSEAILIDPSAFLGPAPRNETAIGSTVAAIESSDASFRTVDNMGNDNETQYVHENTQRRINRAALASDADADVSSLETDAADSDN